MRVFLAACVIVAALFASAASAQDPAPGWLAYLQGHCPAGTHLTHMEAKWKVLNNAPQSFAFYSPWFGADTTDNLNLIQPVNPWFGSSWSAYTEFYRWTDGYNSNSNQIPTQPGHVMHGQLTFLGEAQQAYKLVQTDMNSRASSSQVVQVQQHSDGSYKKFTVLYFVFEKVANCNEYPPNEKVVFYDIIVQCNNTRVYPTYRAGVVENVCDFKGHTVSNTSVMITWDTSSTRHPTPEQFARNNLGGFRRH
jgi:hypothetical protein